MAGDNCKIGEPVIVVVPRCAGERANTRVETSLLGNVPKFPIAEIVVEDDTTLGAVVRQENVDISIIVVVKETRARCHPPSSSCTSRKNPRVFRHIYKLHRNLWRYFHRGGLRLLGQRIFTLLAVGQAHGRAKLVSRDVLE